MSADEREPRFTECSVCGGPGELHAPPGDYFWSHLTHPVDGHEFAPLRSPQVRFPTTMDGERDALQDTIDERVAALLGEHTVTYEGPGMWVCTCGLPPFPNGGKGRAHQALAIVTALDSYTQPATAEICGAWDGCPLPRGHNMGRADVRSNHRAPFGRPSAIPGEAPLAVQARVRLGLDYLVASVQAVQIKQGDAGTLAGEYWRGYTACRDEVTNLLSESSIVQRFVGHLTQHRPADGSSAEGASHG